MPSSEIKQAVRHQNLNEFGGEKSDRHRLRRSIERLQAAVMVTATSLSCAAVSTEHRPSPAIATAGTNPAALSSQVPPAGSNGVLAPSQLDLRHLPRRPETEIYLPGSKLRETVTYPFNGWLKDPLSPVHQEFIAANNVRFKDYVGLPAIEAVYKTLADRNARPLKIPSSLKFDRGRVIQYWADSSQPKGVFRVAPQEDFFDTPGNPIWQVLIDYDHLAAAEGKNWKRISEYPNADYSKVLVTLSDSGSDIHFIRLWDVANKRFIPGFEVSVRLSSSAYLGKAGQEKVYFTSVAESEKNAKEVRVWDPVHPDQSGKILFTVKPDHQRVELLPVELESGKQFLIIREDIDRESHEYYLLDPDNLGTPIKLEIPPRSIFDGNTSSGQLLFRPTEKFSPAGEDLNRCVLGIDLPGLLKSGQSQLLTIYKVERDPGHPWDKEAINLVASSGPYVYIATVRDGGPRLLRVKLGPAEDGFRPGPVSQIELPSGPGMIGRLVSFEGSGQTGGVVVGYANPITPSGIYVEKNSQSALGAALLQAAPRYDVTNITSTIRFAKSADGARLPYIVIDGRLDKSKPAPTMVTVHGASRFIQQSGYPWDQGAVLLERGGVYIIASVRGGGENGWYEAGTGHNRQAGISDLICILESICKEGLSTPAQMGITASSAGAVVAMGVYNQRPDLASLIVVHDGLMNMLEYLHLNPNTINAAEYGNPENESDFPALRATSPYHNLRRRGRHPDLVMIVAGNDSRVPDFHSLQLQAALLDHGVDNAFVFHLTEGGHIGGGIVDVNSWMYRSALALAAESKVLGLGWGSDSGQQIPLAHIHKGKQVPTR